MAASWWGVVSKLLVSIITVIMKQTKQLGKVKWKKIKQETEGKMRIRRRRKREQEEKGEKQEKGNAMDDAQIKRKRPEFALDEEAKDKELESRRCVSKTKRKRTRRS